MTTAVSPSTLSRPSLPSVSAWGVAHTRSRSEKAFASYLERNGVGFFLPLLSNRRVYGRRVRISQVPLFSGYVFFDIGAFPRHKAFESRRVAEVLEPSDPEKLNEELQQLATAISLDTDLREARFGKVGRSVVVKSGPMKGLIGEIVRLDENSTLVLKVSFLRKAVELAIDEAFVEPVL